MAGVLLVLMGVFRLGAVIKFIPYPVVVGFTSGIAVTIFTTQIADVFGLDFGGEKVPGDFVGKWLLYFRHFGTVDWWNAAVSVLSVLIIALSPKFSKKIPGSLIAIVVVTVGVYFLKRYGGIEGIDTIGDRFTIRSSLPGAAVPELNWEAIKNLFPVAVTIAVLGAIESLLSATVADGRNRRPPRLEYRTDRAGSGQSGDAAVRRYSRNGSDRPHDDQHQQRGTDAGSRNRPRGRAAADPVVPDAVGAVHPDGLSAGVLIVVSYNMSGWRTFRALLSNPRADVTVLLLTFSLTVLFDLTVAIEVGLLIACVLFMKRVMETTEISVIRDEIDPGSGLDVAVHEEHLTVPRGVEVYEINGPYFFGIATKFEELMAQLGDRPKVRVIRMRKVPFIDSTGIHNLTNLCVMSRREKIEVVLSGVNDTVHAALQRSGFYELLGPDNICPNINAALERARRILGE